MQSHDCPLQVCDGRALAEALLLASPLVLQAGRPRHAPAALAGVAVGLVQLG